MARHRKVELQKDYWRRVKVSSVAAALIKTFVDLLRLVEN
jgi:hypothetical protein